MQSGRDLCQYHRLSIDHDYAPIRTLYFALLIALVLGGINWMAGNIHEVPQYGDTVEYLRLARTIDVDQYRTILYPWFLHLCAVSATIGKASNPFWAYLGQIALSLVASMIFGSALSTDLAATRKTGAKNWLIVAIVALATTTCPLMAHFSLSLMSDSIASSLTVATVGSIAHVLASYKKSNGLCGAGPP